MPTGTLKVMKNILLGFKHTRKRQEDIEPQNYVSSSVNRQVKTLLNTSDFGWKIEVGKLVANVLIYLLTYITVA